MTKSNTIAHGLPSYLAAACISLTNNPTDGHRPENCCDCRSSRTFDQAASLSYCAAAAAAAEAEAAAEAAAADTPHISGGPDRQLWQRDGRVQSCDWVTDPHAPILKAHE